MAPPPSSPPPPPREQNDWLGSTSLVSPSDLPYSSPPPREAVQPSESSSSDSPSSSPSFDYGGDQSTDRILYPGQHAQHIADDDGAGLPPTRREERQEDMDVLTEVDLSRPHEDEHSSFPEPLPLPTFQQPPKQSTRFATSVDVHEMRQEEEEEDISSHAPLSSPFLDEFNQPSNVRPGFYRTESVMSDAESDRGEGDDDVLYDWEDEADLVDTEAAFEASIGIKREGKKKWGVKRIITLLFSSLAGSTFLSACLVSIPVAVYFLYEKPDPTERRKYVSDNIGAWFYFAAFNMLVSWYLAVAVDLIPAVATMFVHIFWGEVQESMKTHVETFGIMKSWIKPILYAASFWGSWAVLFGSIYDLYDSSDEGASRAAYAPRMYQVIELLFFACLIYCLEKLLLQFIALSFHRVAFKDRLTDINYNISVLDRLNLYRPKRKEPSASHTAFSSPFGAFNNHTTTPPSYSSAPPSRPTTPTMNPSTWGRAFNGSPSIGGATKQDRSRTNSERLPSEPRDSSFEMREEEDRLESAGGPGAGKGSGGGGGGGGGASKMASVFAKRVKTAALHDARNVKGKDGGGADKMAFSVANPKAAKQLARLIYTSYKPVGAKRSYLIPSDFFCAYASEAEAKLAFKVFDKDGNDDISKQEIKTVVMQTYKERRFLAKSMQDVGNAVKSLNYVLLAIAAIILFFIALSVLGVELGTQFTSLYTIGLGLSFIFQSAASNAFDSISPSLPTLSILATHTDALRDRVFIGAENLVVKEMAIFSTTFIRVDGTLATYYNSILFGMKIINVRRSGNMVENCTIQVGWQTTEKQLDDLEKSICTWLSTDEKRDIGASTAIMYQSINFQQSIELTILIVHLATWQDWGARWARRTRFHAAVKHYLEQHDITCYNSPLPLRILDHPDTYPRTPTSETQNQPPRSPLSRVPTRSASRRRPASSNRTDIPVSPGGGNGADIATEPMKQTLGFLPPAEERGALMTMRRRKGGSRKALLAASGA
ncbi:hypothetical protein BDY24DRAFT_434761 [Mrakia frigida]|uniref:uncharacterized protein n=1 Tax=Mrakia frigida TaxID=29902 RepID=UPI003FCC1299